MIWVMLLDGSGNNRLCCVCLFLLLIEKIEHTKLDGVLYEEEQSEEGTRGHEHESLQISMYVKNSISGVP